MKKNIDTKYFKGQYFLRIEHIISRFTHVPEKLAHEHLEYNEKVWYGYLGSNESIFLENQPGLKIFKYGKYKKLPHKAFAKDKELDASFGCCVVMSVYNVERFLNSDNIPSFPKILYELEKKYTLLWGYWGVSFLGALKYLKDKGYKVGYVSGKKINESSVGVIEKEYDAYMFMAFNNSRNIGDMLHSMCVTKDKEGFFVHNSFATPKYYGTLFDAVVRYNEYKDNKSAPIIVMGIKK